MRFRLALALLISILLVVTASWSRFGTTNYAPSIATLEQIQTDNEYYSDDSFIRDFLKPSTASTTLPAEPLSNTELIGRQLILDYIGLATSGQATEANIDAVANKYLESIPKIIKVQKISRSDIKIVPDNKSNFQNYADQILKIHREYAENINKAYTGANSLKTLNPAMYAFTLTFNISYINAANGLKNLPVPTSLADLHLQLINSYFSSAASMKALSETEQDSTAAFAGLIILNENLDKEDVILNEISNILTANGI
ncbi:MAG: hypothetical protein UT07_C0004G0003 [Parcubacteria group bacterium GW2011_GWB1_38_8]|nr:MAG: hypothetical protein UT07_C0004G0003 [Parcubacteria group bacterium GW2011_GWB1_38_8]